MTPRLLVARAIHRSLTADHVAVTGAAVDNAAQAALAAMAEWDRREDARYDHAHGIGRDVA